MTKWWNDEVARVVKGKKVAWAAYKRSKSPQDWEAYVRRRNIAKETVKQTRSKAWEDFGKVEVLDYCEMHEKEERKTGPKH